MYLATNNRKPREAYIHRDLFFSYYEDSRVQIAVLWCHHGPKLLLIFCSVIFFVWLQSSWSQKSCCTTKHSVHILGRKKSEGRGFSLNVLLPFCLEKDVPPCSAILMLAIWSQSRFHRLRTSSSLDYPHFRQQPQAQGVPGHLRFRTTEYKFGGSHYPLGFCNLLE